MSNVFVDIGMSLDGYIAGPNGGSDNPLGDGGTRIHEWMFEVESWRQSQSMEGGETNLDNEIAQGTIEHAGAYVMGRRMFDEGEHNWPDPPPLARRCSCSPASLATYGPAREGRASTS